MTDEHGNVACYWRGCREPQCVEAKRAYQRDYYHRRAEGYRERARTYYWDHIEERRAYSREYRRRKKQG